VAYLAFSIITPSVTAKARGRVYFSVYFVTGHVIPPVGHMPSGLFRNLLAGLKLLISGMAVGTERLRMTHHAQALFL
jgi:hypothetical protein